MNWILGIALVVIALPASTESINERRALFNYQMSCQGCHAPDASGANAVPRMRDYVGQFLRTQNGREYLVRVPGSAVSALNDRDLAEVLNWIIIEFAGDSVTAPFQPYTAAEVGRLRQDPLYEVEQHRAKLLVEIASTQAETETR